MARKCLNQTSKDHPQAAAKSFFMPGDAFAQLHDLSSYMAFAAVSTTLGGTSDTLETEADWDISNDEPRPQAASYEPNVHNFVGLVFGPARGLTDTGAQQLVVGASAAQWRCERLRKRHRLVPVDVTPSNMIATCGGIRSAKVLRVLDFIAGIIRVNGGIRFLVLEETMSPHGKQQFIPPLTPITLMRQLGANIRMRERENDPGKIHTEKLVREGSGHVHNWLDSFSNVVGTCHTTSVFS